MSGSGTTLVTIFFYFRELEERDERKIFAIPEPWIHGSWITAFSSFHIKPGGVVPSLYYLGTYRVRVLCKRIGGISASLPAMAQYATSLLLVY